MNCFIDYIGIKVCGTSESGSGLFINQLPGITFNMIDSIVEQEQKTFVELWNDIQQRGLQRFKTDYKAKFENKYEGFCCNDEECDPEYIACENKELFKTAWWYCLGVELMLERMYSSRLNRYTTIDKRQAEELKDHYTVEYEKYLNSAIKHIPKEFIENCFECKSGVRHVQSLP